MLFSAIYLTPLSFTRLRCTHKSEKLHPPFIFAVRNAGLTKLNCCNHGEPIYRVWEPICCVREPIYRVRELIYRVREPIYRVREPIYRVRELICRVRELICRAEEPIYRV